ncbi:MAG: hypothetical protein BZ136_05615 [Methanosphaera sp. rholeuAM74]|nr:MAG: hypothetical protein BZ136_05615 [Methanosphaera sp. rholeuAM74]
MAVEAHRHCAICGRPIPMDESFCSDVCQEAYEMKKNQVAKQRKILVGLVVIFVLIYIFMVFFKH